MVKIEVTEIHKTSKCIQVNWSMVRNPEEGKQKFESAFYHRTDGTWGMSPELKSQPPMVRSMVWILATDKSFPKLAAKRTASIRYDYHN